MGLNSMGEQGKDTSRGGVRVVVKNRFRVLQIFKAASFWRVLRNMARAPRSSYVRQSTGNRTAPDSRK